MVVSDKLQTLKDINTLASKYDIELLTTMHSSDIIERVKDGESFDLILLEDDMKPISGFGTLGKLQEAKEGFNRYNVFLSKNTFQIEITTKAKTGKTLLLIKDSFANCFVPFLTENYDRIILIDYRYGKLPIGQILDKYEDITDVLVMFNTEKFMQNTKLAGLANAEKKKQTLEEFNPDDFLE